MIKEFEIPLYTGRAVVCVSEDAWTELKNAGLPVGGRKKRKQQPAGRGLMNAQQVCQPHQAQRHVGS